MTSGRLWPALALAAAGGFAATVWVAGSAPAFTVVDRSLAPIPAAALAGGPVDGLRGQRPAVVLVWMPG